MYKRQLYTLPKITKNGDPHGLTRQTLRDLGSIQSPQNAYLLNLGLESLQGGALEETVKNAFTLALGEGSAANVSLGYLNGTLTTSCLLYTSRCV